MVLKDKYRQHLETIFSSVEIPIEVWAHGSRVDGTAHEGSDLDLVVRTKNLEQLPMDVLLAIKEKIKESNIPIVVEVFDWSRLPEYFQKNIIAKHIVLFSNM
ncbi:MAG: nucleotidyltransferase domain-containing protein [Bacteroidetes bacterium]|nr:nucleotidyltransferase domain-containing protein [Bacteroidota bacterium]